MTLALSVAFVQLPELKMLPRALLVACCCFLLVVYSVYIGKEAALVLCVCVCVLMLMG